MASLDSLALCWSLSKEDVRPLNGCKHYSYEEKRVTQYLLSLVYAERQRDILQLYRSGKFGDDFYPVRQAVMKS
jgi:hypothetical protein